MHDTIDIRVLILLYRKREDLDISGLKYHLLSRTSTSICSFSINLTGTKAWWHLRYTARKIFLNNIIYSLFRRGASFERSIFLQWSLGIVCETRSIETKLCGIDLVTTDKKLDQLGRCPCCNQKKTRCEGIKSSRMAYTTYTKLTSHVTNNIKARYSAGLVNKEESHLGKEIKNFPRILS